MDFQEAFDTPAFWGLALGGIATVLIGYIFSKKAGMMVLPVWQLLLIMVVVVVASVFFVTKD